MNKYVLSTAIAIQHQLDQKAQLLGRLFLYVVIVFLFNQVFQSVHAEPTRIWYVAITEWFILSSVPIPFHIAEDINSGQIVFFRLRPIHYLTFKFCESVGVFLVRFFILGLTCLSLCYYLTSFIPGSIITWIKGILFGFLGIILYTLILTVLGLLAFWFREIKNLIYLNLTMTFCFGGLIVPLNFYSEWMRMVSLMTPYPWILWAPAETITGGGIQTPIVLLAFGVWFGILMSIVLYLYRKGMQQFIMEGG